ncbi:hypothetical protein AHF37_07745 [Paragonimus kellicotti]|nr:hypothetical protein AHF37_07745 [Paragonimus kellicotti]
MTTGIHETGQLFTQVVDSIDCSSSSCPPSASSEESVPEGYLILTFDKSKRAKLKTEIFADVSSDCRFDDDFDDDNLGEDEAESGYAWSNTELQTNSMNSPSHNRAADSGEQLGSLTTVAPEEQNSVLGEKALHASDCYGEAVWVGESKATTEDQLQRSSNAVQSNEPSCLIRTSPIANRTSNQPRIVHDLRASPVKSATNAQLTHPGLSTNPSPPLKYVQHSQLLQNRMLIPSQQNLSLSVRVANKHALESPSSNLSPWSHLRSGGFVRHRLSASADSYTDDSEAGSARYPRKMLRCDACGKYYRNEYSLHHHICLKRKDVWRKGDIPSEVVDGQVIYFCPTCHKPFKWLGNLTRHFYVHTGQRFFKCDICSKEFFSAYQVKRHMNSHTGRRFKCEVCDKPFTCKYACAWHTRQHYSSVE